MLVKWVAGEREEEGEEEGEEGESVERVWEEVWEEDTDSDITIIGVGDKRRGRKDGDEGSDDEALMVRKGEGKGEGQGNES
jgi:hypothetical protein